MKYLLLVLENIRRNVVRTALTSLGTMVLVLVVTLVFTVLTTLDRATTEKSQNLKAIVTERWQIPSQMPYAYAPGLIEGAAREPGDERPDDWMTWGFYAGSTEPDPKKRSFENLVFAFVIDPVKLGTMMDDIELPTLPADQARDFQAAIQRLEETRQGIIVGSERLKKLQKRVGDRITLYGRNYKDIDLEVEIVGVFPPSRYDMSAALRRDYFNNAMDVYQQTHGGKPHPLADKTLNLVWLRLGNRQKFSRVSEQIVHSPSYTQPAVKCETSSSGITTFLEAYRDILFAMRWLLAPACVVTLALVICNAISISVRERQIEFAVLKVLGFRPRQILALVLGEALLIGTMSGFASAALAYYAINAAGGLPFQIGFFPKFLIPIDCLWWGAAMGAGTAFAGSFFPSLSASAVRVANVFSKVA